MPNGRSDAPLYVETSALLRVMLEGDRALAKLLANANQVVTSALTFVEASRAFRRARRQRRIDARMERELGRQLRAFENSAAVMALDEEVLSRSKEEFPVEPIRTLDGIHLASILIWEREEGEIVVASCDHRVRDNLNALGVSIVSDVLIAARRGPIRGVACAPHPSDP